jgi:GntR family transcriptional regulator
MDTTLTAAPIPDGKIDRVSPIPFYFQLAQLLEEEITSGGLQAGWRLPSEPELSERFEVSRTTVRQALARLESRGLIERRKGQGTFVRAGEPGFWSLESSDASFQNEIDRTGRTVTSRILAADRGLLPAWACEALELPRGSTGATLERVRSVDGLVVLYVINHLPDRYADAALAISNPNESLYRRLRERESVEPHSGRRTLEAIGADSRIAELLELEPAAPVAYIESVAWAADSRPFDCYRAWLRTDRTRIAIRVSGPEAAAVDPLPSEADLSAN